MSLTLFLASAASCTCSERETTTAHVDGTISASLVEVKKTGVTVGGVGGGHVGIIYPAPDETILCEVRITKPKELTYESSEPCEGRELVADPTGTRLAWGAPAEPHHLLYFGSHGRSFDAPTTIPAPIDWTKVASLADTLPILLERALREDSPNHKSSIVEAGEIVEELVEVRGSHALLAPLIAAIALPFASEPSGQASLFRAAMAKLEPTDRAALDAELERTLTSTKPSADALARALSILDLEKAPHDDAIAARTEELVAARDPIASSVFAVTIRRIAATKPAVAGSLACKRLTGFTYDDFVDADLANDAGAALVVLAATKTPCAAVAPLFDKVSKEPEFGLCSIAAWFCPESSDPREVRTRCSGAELEARAKRLATPPWSELKEHLGASERLFFTGVALAANLVTTIPASFQRLVARQSYPWKKASVHGLSCFAATAGKICEPAWEALGSEVCRDGTRVDLGSAMMVVDDKGHERWFEGSDDDAGDSD